MAVFGFHVLSEDGAFSMKKLKNKIALTTGAGSGMDQAQARLFAQ